MVLHDNTKLGRDYGYDYGGKRATENNRGDTGSQTG